MDAGMSPWKMSVISGWLYGLLVSFVSLVLVYSCLLYRTLMRQFLLFFERIKYSFSE